MAVRVMNSYNGYAARNAAVDLRHTLGGVPAAADTGYRPIRMDHNATWFIGQPLCSKLRL